ncbi:hypothetical protein WJX81_006326 [Elliptochloris bilobata]|uniref:procollagen-proline 4-dioxygenase n=1 Tax=Elliptochloris bilobata TaxID=381761 RepID=A0AAW1S825_9CHLO
MPGQQEVEDAAPPPSWVEILSWQPRAFLWHGFLSASECQHIMRLAKPQMRRSTVVGANGSSVTDGIRTSYGTFLRRLQDPVIAAVELRLALWTQLNISHQEDMQILRYEQGQQYGAHYDSLQDHEGSPRVATVLIYLNSDPLLWGGETAFPEGSAWLHPAAAHKSGPFSECARGHVAVRPRLGDALLFFNLLADGQQDQRSMHAGCPVLDGIKWTATKWIHAAPFRPEWLGAAPAAEAQRPEECTDANANCRDWAKKGECSSNRDFMEGDGYTLDAEKP